METQETPYPKTYKLKGGSQEFTVDFKGCDRQFVWLEISLLYYKNDKHLTIYESYYVEYSVTMIKKIELSNILDTYKQQIWWNSIPQTTHKNVCYGNNMLPDIVTVILPRQFRTTSTIWCFKSSYSSRIILPLNPMKKYILISETVSDKQARLKNQAEVTLKLM